MARYMSGSQFAIKAGIRVAVFVALTLGFPLIVYGLIVATGANRVGGASGALAAVAGIYLKPIIVLVFALSLIGICWRRIRSLGLPGFCGLLVPFLFLMDATYLLVVGAHWGTAFSLGVMFVGPPVFAAVGLVTMVAMSMAHAPSDDAAPDRLLRGLLWCCAVLAVMLVVVAWMTSSTVHWINLIRLSYSGRLDPALMGVSKATIYAYMLKPWLCAAYCAVVAALTALSWKASRGQTGGGGEAEPPHPVLSPSPASAGVAFGKR